MDHFATSLDHLLAELERLDLLIRVQVWRARQAHADGGELQGLYISEQEVDALLDKAIGAPVWATVALPADALQRLQATLDAMAVAIEGRKAASRAHGVRLRLDELAHHFDLSLFDLDAVLVCLAPELDLRYARLYAYLHDDVTRRHPSIDLLLNLLCPRFEARLAAHARLTADAPLRRHHLLHLLDDPSERHTPWLAQSLKLDDRVARYLIGGDELDARLLPYARLVAPAAELADLRLPIMAAQRLAAHARRGEPLICYLQGPYGVGKQTTAEALCRAAGQGLLLLSGERLAAVGGAEFAPLAHLADREAQLQGAALYWDGCDALLADHATGADGSTPQAQADRQVRRAALLDVLASRPGLTFLAGAAAWEPGGALAAIPFVRVELPLPSAAERQQLWAQQVKAGNLDLAAVAGAFRFSAGQIRDAAATARNLARWRNPSAAQVELADLYAASRLHSNRRLAALARKVESHDTWDDIVLPPERLELLHAICQQAAYRAQVYDAWGFARKLALGNGINVLFAGPPGTGKTMAAGIIAGALQLDLYKIDLATVVSKYIGETEKNLARIFAEAATSNAILFFDEADALFGKRTEVKDAHDRYANLEISYLLQQMEEYSGVAILATNLRANVDDAFVRRMHVIVEFPFPQAADRRRIWARIWPDATPRAADLDLDFMAERVAVAGGSIRNIAVAAAFLAAAEGCAVSMAHLVRATAREYQKIGKLVAADEFGAYSRYLAAPRATGSGTQRVSPEA